MNNYRKDPSVLTHLKQTDGLTEFCIPVLVTGVKYVRIKAKDRETDMATAENQVEQENKLSSDGLSDCSIKAMRPVMALKPEDRASWPYWRYGWSGTDGVDWRSYQTDKGPHSIPDMAEESYPIPPF